MHTTVAVLFRAANCHHVGGQRKRNKQKHELELSLIRHITRKYNQIRRANKSTTFNVHGSVHRTNILVYKSQQDAHVTDFIFV